MKDIVACLDVDLSKRKLVKICKEICEKNNLFYDEHTNINGGKYIQIMFPNVESKYVDIYYKCQSNKRLYETFKTNNLFDKEQMCNIIRKIKEELI